MHIKVLLVEDDENFAQSVIHFLELKGLHCDYARNGVQGVSLMANNNYDVVISDINMPKMDGLDLCQTMRKAGNDTPLILLTALDDIEDKLAGFASGADDYLSKPFEMRELFARLKSLAMRRSGNAKKLYLQEINLELRIDEHVVLRDGQKIELTRSNWCLLEAIARAYPHPISKAELEFALWGDDVPDSKALKAHIHRLRQRLDKPFSTPLLHIVSGFGVQLKSSK